MVASLGALPCLRRAAAAAEAAAKDWRHRIARRAAREIHDGFYVNLGVGIPTLVPEHLDPSVKVWLESENGILGMGPYPTKEQVDPYVLSFVRCAHSDSCRMTAISSTLARRPARFCPVPRHLVCLSEAFGPALF